MCRWLAYIGQPIYIDTLVTKPSSSLVEQSLNAKMSFKRDGSILSTNGDGFGVGWYTKKKEPGLFKGAEPAWNNENLIEVCTQTKAHIFMAHIRAASTGNTQRSNSHPFKYNNWLFQHNGYVDNFPLIRRDLQFDILPELYATLKGTTDSETFFLLALTYGLQDNPKRALEKMIRRIQQACTQKNIDCNLVLSCALSDGDTLYTLRYASGTHAHSQYYSNLSKDSIVIVSEPLDQAKEQWQEMPHHSFSIIKDGHINSEKLSI